MDRLFTAVIEDVYGQPLQSPKTYRRLRPGQAAGTSGSHRAKTLLLGNLGPKWACWGFPNT